MVFAVNVMRSVGTGRLGCGQNLPRFCDFCQPTEDSRLMITESSTPMSTHVPRIVIVGGVAAGASAAAKARRTNENCDIVMVDAGPYMSFANCGLPYYVGGEIHERDALFVAEAELFAERFGVDVRLETRAERVDAEKKTVSLLTRDGRGETLTYDRLILATGTEPLIPPIENIGNPSVFMCRTVPDVDRIMSRMRSLLPHEFEGSQHRAVRDSRLRALIIGAGYIGLECAEQLMHRGFVVTVVERAGQIMNPLDQEMTLPLQGALEAAGASVILNDAVTRIDGRSGRYQASLQSGRQINYDIAILSVGVRPAVKLAREAGVKLGETGAIAVDEFQRTSHPAIFAAGDNCEAPYLPNGRPVNIPLAGPANKQGRIAGANAALDLAGADGDHPERLRFRGVLGTSIVRACGMIAGGTGLNEKQAKKLEIPCQHLYATGPSHAGYYPGAEPILLKLTYATDSGRILGAQMTGKAGVDKRLDIMATAIYGGLTVEDLEQLDLAYAPPFGAAKDVSILAGFIASNARRGSSPGVTAQDLLAELDSDKPPLVIDVRTDREYAAAHFQRATNIPLDEVRERIQEIPRDRPVVVHCGVGYRSYTAQQILRNHGYRNVRNLYGGYGLLEMLLPPERIVREEILADVAA